MEILFKKYLNVYGKIMEKIIFLQLTKNFLRGKKEIIFGKNQYFIGLHFQIINSSGSPPRASRIRFAEDSSRTRAQGFGSGGLRHRRG